MRLSCIYDTVSQATCASTYKDTADCVTQMRALPKGIFGNKDGNTFGCHE